ncbi:hypothetical protein IYR97_23755 (plasmid) [Pseudomonas fulva]|jgi:hypothetical protein|uniref:Uncharacterized protein n=3 Tax=Pseudomonas TaxID=286 RepID=A0A1X0ZMV8_PSEPU|nr:MULTISPECIES: hypothetical protein [Pseudomonas]MCT8164059.1 hypothetical protein [Pseudomonas sp. HD6422]MCT8182953.1 hypothetical protein [Pseudomonas sp. HD6421]MDH1930425.1 hypothetical protein [Pseudomonas sp. GD03696]MDM1711778.1 hypothetical protein [Pseudomonas sp. 165]ORL53079.1 hypothetical protein B7H18_03595 [Pseudomonas putida]
MTIFIGGDSPIWSRPLDVGLDVERIVHAFSVCQNHIDLKTSTGWPLADFVQVSTLPLPLGHTVSAVLPNQSLAAALVQNAFVFLAGQDQIWTQFNKELIDRGAPCERAGVRRLLAYVAHNGFANFVNGLLPEDFSDFVDCVALEKISALHSSTDNQAVIFVTSTKYKTTNSHFQTSVVMSSLCSVLVTRTRSPMRIFSARRSALEHMALAEGSGTNKSPTSWISTHIGDPPC